MMKLGIVISVQKTDFAAAAYATDLEESIRKAAELGYDGVELAVRDPEAVDTGAVRAIVDKYHLEVPAIGTGQAYLAEGLSFTEEKEEGRKAAVERIKAHIAFAASFNAGVIIGLIRGSGRGERTTEQQKLSWLDAAMNECALSAEEKKVTLFIEPLNRYETGLINTVEEGIALIERISQKNVKLLIDTFHMNIEEPSMLGSIVSAESYVGHVHFADSNREAPGRGHLDFADIVDALKAVGYDGYVSMEMLPLPSADRSAQMAISCLKNIINAAS